MARSGGKCIQVRSIACTGPLLPERPGEGGRAGKLSRVFKKIASAASVTGPEEEG